MATRVRTPQFPPRVHVVKDDGVRGGYRIVDLDEVQNDAVATFSFAGKVTRVRALAVTAPSPKKKRGRPKKVQPVSDNVFDDLSS